MQVFIRVLPYVRRYPFLAFGTLFCAVAGTLRVIVFPAITQQIEIAERGQVEADQLIDAATHEINDRLGRQGG